MDSKRAKRRVTMFTIFLVLTLFAFPFSMTIFGDTPLQLITVLVGISILVLMLFLHREGVKEDEARGICRGKNRVWVVRLAGGVLCLTGMGFAFMTWGGLSVVEPFTWLRVLLVLFFILWGAICFAAASEYNRTIDRLEEYEAQLKHLGYELDELGRLSPTASREDSGHGG